MHLTFDPDHNIAYLRFQKKGAEVETLSLSDELNIDLAPDGTLYGIELLNANEQLAQADNGMLIVAGKALGKSREIPLVEAGHEKSGQ